MGVFSRFFEKRSGLANPSKWFVDAMTGGQSSYTGKNVTAENALSHTAVFACVRILSETVASLPLPVYKRLEKGKEKAQTHYLYSVLQEKANSEMTAFTFRETAMGHLLLWGNMYAEKEYDSAGRVRGLWPLRPDQTWPERENGKIVYKTILPDGTQVKLPKDRVLHIPGMGFDGLVGYNPIKLAREAIGLGLAAEEYGSRFFGNGAKPGGVLEHPGALKEGALKNLRESWNEMHSGLSNQHRIAILEQGMSYKQIGIPPEEAQFLETRKFQVTEIARFFRVPPHMLADLERATFSNIEHQSIDFVVHTIRPWLVRWEQAINSELFGIDSKVYFSEFNVDGLLRGDIKSRYEAYAIARQNGWLSANDIRSMENQNPIENGDIYLVPLNMVPAEMAGKTATREEPSTEEGRSLEIRSIRKVPVLEIRRKNINSYRRLMEEGFTRITSREEADIMRQAKKMFGKRSIEDFLTWLSDFYKRHETYVENVMTPVFLSLAETMAADAMNEVGESDEINLEEFVAGFTALMISRHIGSSINRIKKVVEGAGAGEQDLIDALQSEFDDWKENRVASATKEEMTRASNAFLKQSYIQLGVKELRWVADNDPCEFCQSLDGKTIEINSYFVNKGESLQANGETLTPSRNIGHAPLHAGCTCTVEAVL